MRPIGELRNYPVIFLSLLLLLASCQHKELEYDDGRGVEVQVVFDWTKAPQADPETMSLYLYPEDGGETRYFQFSGRDGGMVRLKPGRYSSIVLNDDSETARIRNTDRWETFEVNTAGTSIVSTSLFSTVRAASAPRAGGTEEEMVTVSPDGRLWTDSRQGIEIKYETGLTPVLTFTPESRICNVTVEIVNGENLKYIEGISGALTSVAGGFLVGLAIPTSEKVTHPFDLTIEKDLTTITGALKIFGCCPDTDGTHALTVYTTLTDGKAYYYTYDVTDQMHDAADRKNIHIRIDGLPSPRPITNGSGFSPDVDSWDEIEIELPMR